MDLQHDTDETAPISLADTFDTVPLDIRCDDPVFSLTFHPSAPYLAIGQVGGAINIHEYRGAETRFVTRLQLHSGGVSGMEFTENGSHLVSVSSDRSIDVLDCNTQKSIMTIARGKGNPHKAGLSAVNICTDTLIATGDDEGKVCLFDTRSKKCVQKFFEHADYIATMLYFSEVNQLVSGSGDTCLGVFDLRGNRVVDVSDKRKDEINAIAFVPETNDIIAGTPSGTLPVWRYGGWIRPYDVYDSHPKDCETIITYNDNIVLTGAADGLLRVLQVHPVKRNLCQLGGNQRQQGISKLSISADRNMAAAADTDNVVSFIDISFLADDTELDRLRSRAEKKHLSVLRDATAEREAAEAEGAASEDDSDDDESDDTDEDSDDSDDDDDDEEEGTDSCDDSDERGSGNSKKMATSSKAAAVVAALKEKKSQQQQKGNDTKTASKTTSSKAARSVDTEDGGQQHDSDDSDVDESDDDSYDDENRPKTEREKKRERVAAAKWMKAEKKKKVNFQFERKRRRVGGFWGDIK